MAMIFITADVASYTCWIEIKFFCAIKFQHINVIVIKIYVIYKFISIT